MQPTVHHQKKSHPSIDTDNFVSCRQSHRLLRESSSLTPPHRALTVVVFPISTQRSANSQRQPQRLSLRTTMPNFHPPQPLSYQPASVHNSNLDAYILSGLFFYSAAFALVHRYLYIFSFLSFSVLLLNGAYLNTPRHLPSLLLSLFPALLPFYRLYAVQAFRITINWLPKAPLFILELVLGVVIVGNLIRHAIYIPFFKSPEENRRYVAPISPQDVVPTQEVRQEWQEAARTLEVQQADDAAGTCGTSTGAQKESEGPEQTPGGDSEFPVDQDSSTKTEAEAPNSTSVEQAQAAAQTVLQAKPPSSKPKPKPRRRIRLTKSQIVAAQIMRQRDAEAAARRDKEQRERNARRLQEEQARTEREARRAERERLQEAVREAAKGVADAKEALKTKSLDADKAREGRRRAADQLNLAPGEENEKVLDEACRESARVEMEEQRALDDVNAAQARLIDLRGQLNVHHMV